MTHIEHILLPLAHKIPSPSPTNPQPSHRITHMYRPKTAACMKVSDKRNPQKHNLAKANKQQEPL